MNYFIQFSEVSRSNHLSFYTDDATKAHSLMACPKSSRSLALKAGGSNIPGLTLLSTMSYCHPNTQVKEVHNLAHFPVRQALMRPLIE